MKICPKCKQNLDLSEFCKDNKRKDKLQLWCKKCNNQNRKFHYHNNPQNKEIVKRQAKDSQLKAQFDITLQEYEKILKNQNGVCAICKTNNIHKSNPKGIIDRLSVDHNHQTGKIRGLLCSRCNFGIGQFNDDPILLMLAINYLFNYMSDEEIFGKNKHTNKSGEYTRNNKLNQCKPPNIVVNYGEDKTTNCVDCGEEVAFKEICGLANDWQTPFNEITKGFHEGSN